MARPERSDSVEELRSATLDGTAFRDEPVIFLDGEDNGQVAAAAMDNRRPVRGLPQQLRKPHLRFGDAQTKATVKNTGGNWLGLLHDHEV